jgi:hypothetical protein
VPLWRRHQQADVSEAPPSAPQPATPAASPQHSPNEPIGTRQRWQVERLRDQAAHEYTEALKDPQFWGKTVDWKRGITDAGRWALGELESAPISGTYTGLGVVPDIDLMETEDDKAEWALRHPSEVGHSSSYANGVQHTMMWIVGDTETSPIGFDD